MSKDALSFQTCQILFTLARFIDIFLSLTHFLFQGCQVSSCFHSHSVLMLALFHFFKRKPVNMLTDKWKLF